MTKIKYIGVPGSVDEAIHIGDLEFDLNGKSVEVDEDHPEHDMLVANPTFEVVKETLKTKKVKAEAKKADEKDGSKTELKKDSAVVDQSKQDAESGAADEIKGE